MARVNVRDAAVYRVFGETARVRLPIIAKEIMAIARADLYANHYRSGDLAGSLDVKFFWSPIHPSFSIFSHVKYAYYVHEGAAAHVISGNPLLIFRWVERGGRLVRTTSVNHPGYGGDPFLRNAAYEVVGRR